MALNCKKLIFLSLYMLVACFPAEALETQGFLTEDEIALFYKQGYILKSQCLKEAQMQQLGQDITGVIDQAITTIQNGKDPTFSEDDQVMYINGSRVVYKQRPDESISIGRINGCGGMQPALLATIRSEKMVRTFFELLGTNDLEHLISQIHPKLPGDGIAYPRHRDIEFRKSFDPQWDDILGNGSYAICVIPIEPMTPENGGLWIDQNNYPEAKGEEPDIVWIDARPGDLLFMHPHVYHGSGPNLSANSSRKTLLTGFCAFGANHKTYPGAHVNTRFTLTERGEISMSASPWHQALLPASDAGH